MEWMAVLFVAASSWQLANSNEHIASHIEKGGGRAEFTTVFNRYRDNLVYWNRCGIPAQNITYVDLCRIWELGLIESPFPIVGRIESLTIGEETGKDVIEMFSSIDTLNRFYCENVSLDDVDLSPIPLQKRLNCIDVSNCKHLTAKGLSFAEPANMEHVLLCHTSCGEDLWRVVKNSTDIKYFDLRGSKINDKDLQQAFKWISSCQYLDISYTPCRGRLIRTSINGRVKSLTLDEIQLEDVIDGNESLNGIKYVTIAAVKRSNLSSLEWLRSIQRMTVHLGLEDVDVIHDGRDLLPLDQAILKLQEDLEDSER
ncbi:hypothetical protein Spb1_38840 [Planctopirus ephydatiae]|uniref:Leucine Rich repeats (2 copies) n=1 Tax=Planctopirus ephydatiae TaxID=2528019 RepID=A0A518GTM7_9PLAN|nr:hypothetical protein [Planctopirus ephydatiae]QDV31937.1 hypothetical protein Spb1_38840 [Planctopirus ephydatiae]